MKIIVTAREIMDAGTWSKYCDEHGINPWALNEGLMDSDDKVELLFEEAVRLNLITIEKVERIIRKSWLGE